ncbi:MAG: carboxylate--amine ligase [Candidatus Accumulibacter sp.]|uniref:carboxylate--amine ligase n=1 Tax=Candidatus Accumulibacter TaxID=327159 RepID=UPI00258FCA25|nr:carboxylate--amine ligase [Accumulibacter sp.]MBK8115662.1 carboxylate--amine ligase [Accumulibacter sp.]
MTATSATLPPCIVLGLETQIGVGIVRELGRAGVPVIGITHSANAIGLRSRYLSRKVVVGKPRSDELSNVIRSLGEEFGDICLLTVSEANLQWLIANRQSLGRIRPILPGAEAIRIVLDKQQTLAAARAVGIAVPKTFDPDSMVAVAQAADELKYPVVLKWRDPNLAGPRLSKHGLALEKAEYAQGRQQLLEICHRYEAVGIWPLIQEYCPGVGLGQFFFMHKGEALRRFQHIRIAEWPPEGGFSSVCDSVPLSRHTELQEHSIALLRAIRWEGVAMVEYRFDSKSQRAVLMEINGRYWGSFPLAVHCRAGFAFLAYSVQGLGKVLPMPEPEFDIRCRMVGAEVKRLFRLILQPSKIKDPIYAVEPVRELVRFFVDFFRPRVRYYLWSADDPMPFFADLANLVMRRE